MKRLSNQNSSAAALALALLAQAAAQPVIAFDSVRPSTFSRSRAGNISHTIALSTSPAESRKTIAESAMSEELDRLTERIKNKPDSESLFKRAAIFLAQADMGSAIADLEQSIALDPANIDAVQLLVDCYMQTGQSEKAQSLLKSFLQKHPDKDSAWATLSFVQAATSDLNGAVRSIDRAIELAPENPANWKAKASIYARINDYQKVVEVVEQGLKALPNDETLLFSKAYADETMLGDRALALKEINELIELKPEFLRAYQERAKIELAQGEPLAAKNHDQELLDMIARREAELSKVAVDKVMQEKNILAGTGPVAQAIALLQLRANTLSDKAETEMQLNQLEDAYRDAQEACTRAPRKAAFKSQCGAICFHLGRADEARSLFEAALKLDPHQTISSFYMGFVNLLDGSYDDASHSFAEVVKDKAFQNVTYGYVYGMLAEKLKGVAPQDLDTVIKGANLDLSKWPCPLIKLIEGSATAEALLADTKESGPATELHFALAFLALANHDEKQCRSQFEWINANGAPTFIETAAAKQWLSRKPAGGPS
ncbi:MAG TPA: tetratricopeptide repeat protein [Chroococcales cyanobacterium]